MYMRATLPLLMPQSFSLRDLMFMYKCMDYVLPTIEIKPCVLQWNPSDRALPKTRVFYV